MAIPGEAGTYNMHVRAGTDWRRVFKCQGPDDLTPWLDLTGYGARLKVSEKAGATPVLDKTHTDPQLSLDTVNQTVTVEIKGDLTAAWITAGFVAGEWQVDLLPANDATQTFAFLKGSVLVEQGL
jgi:hypothetical protein